MPIKKHSFSFNGRRRSSSEPNLKTPKEAGRMAKSALVLVSALCFLSLAGISLAETRFFVEGQVYCDTCRIQFFSRASHYIKGAKVRLECSQREGGAITYSSEGETDENGTYSLLVEGDHEEEICSIALIKSSEPDCSEISQKAFYKQSSRISLTGNNGIITPVRQANPLGFLKKDPLSECPEVLRELGFTSSGLI